ncbi:hypothetical protein Tco_0149716 [Tanacetum coccineum]
MPLGYREAMDRWRVAPLSTWYPLLPSEILLPSPPPAAIPPLEHIESVGDDIETMRASLASDMQEMMTLHARVGLLEQHDIVTQDSLRIARGRITQSQLRVVYAEQDVRELREFRVTDRIKILELRSRAEYAESRLEDKAADQRAETLHVSLGAAWMDVRDLLVSHEADRLEMAKLRSRVHDIEASFWDLERHLGP